MHWTAKLAIPFILIGLVLVITRERFGIVWGIMLIYFFSPVGRWVIPMAAVVQQSLNLTPTVWIPLSYIIGIVLFVDFDCALFVIWNFDLLKKVPLISKVIIDVEDRSRKAIEKYRWIIGLQYFGVILFTAIPFWGTNTIIAAIIARFIGMKPLESLIFVMLGSILGIIIVTPISLFFY